MQEVKGRRLERGSDRIVGGVCSGLAGRFSVDPLFVRVAFVLLTLASGAGLVLYVMLWFLVPEEGEPPRDGNVLDAGVRSVEADLRRIFGGVRDSFAAASPPPPAGQPAPRPVPVHRGGLWLGTLLIVLGVAQADHEHRPHHAPVPPGEEPGGTGQERDCCPAGLEPSGPSSRCWP